MPSQTRVDETENGSYSGVSFHLQIGQASSDSCHLSVEPSGDDRRTAHWRSRRARIGGGGGGGAGDGFLRSILGPRILPVRRLPQILANPWKEDGDEATSRSD